MTAAIPEYLESQGMISVWWVPAISSPTGAPTAAEVVAGVDITCFLTDSWEAIGADESRGSFWRACMKEAGETSGRVKRTVADIIYTWLPQTEASDPANKVKSTVGSGLPGHIVVRYGKDAEADPIAAADVVDTIAVTNGVQRKSGITNSEDPTPMTITQSFFTRGTLKEDVAVQA